MHREATRKKMPWRENASRKDLLRRSVDFLTGRYWRSQRNEQGDIDKWVEIGRVGHTFRATAVVIRARNRSGSNVSQQ